MSKAVLIIPLLLLLGLCGLTGNGMHSEKYEVVAEKKATKTVCKDADCFAGKLRVGEPAEFVYSDSGITVKMEVRGKSSSGNTITYVKLEDFDESQIPEQYRMVAGSVKGADMVCALADEDINALLNQSFDEAMLGKCDGPLKGIIEFVASSSKHR